MSANPDLAVQSVAAPVVKSVPSCGAGLFLRHAPWRPRARPTVALRGRRVGVVPRIIGEILIAVGALVWCVVAGFYVAKWFYAQREAAAELEHPVQCCFVGLAGVTALLIGIGATPHLKIAGMVFVLIGGAWVAAFSLWRTGRLWMGGRDHTATTPVLYLPSVAGGLRAGQRSCFPRVA